jgi:hypothetical protein
MRLNSAQLERTLDQFEARPIPDDHPLTRPSGRARPGGTVAPFKYSTAQ